MRRLLIVFAILSVVAPVRAQQAMTVAALQQHMADAQGKVPSQYREETMTSSTGLGIYLRREFRRGDDFRIVYGNGPFQHQRGRLGGKDWDQDANGITSIDASPGTGRPIPLTESVTMVSAPIKAWRYAKLDAGGFGIVQYVDPQTYRVVREEDITPAGHVVRTYSNFGTADGLTIAHHIVTDDEITGTHADADVITMSAHDVSDADLAIPPSRNFVTFPGQAAVSIPATFDVPRVEAHVTIGGHKLDFLVDSAAPGIMLDPTVAQQLGLMSGPQNARSNTTQTVVPEIRVGDLTLKNVVATVAPLSTVEQIDTHAAGVLGYDFMRGATVTIDYKNKRVTAAPPDHFTPPAMTPETGDILPLAVWNHAPLITARINGALAFRVLLDTAAPADLVVFDSFLRRYPEIIAARIARSEDPILYGGIKIDGAKGYKLAEAVVGRFTFNVIDTAVVPALAPLYDGIQDAVFGYGLFDEFAMSFDYPSGRLYLVQPKGK